MHNTTKWNEKRENGKRGFFFFFFQIQNLEQLQELIFATIGCVLKKKIFQILSSCLAKSCFITQKVFGCRRPISYCTRHDQTTPKKEIQPSCTCCYSLLLFVADINGSWWRDNHLKKKKKKKRWELSLIAGDELSGRIDESVVAVACKKGKGNTRPVGCWCTRMSLMTMAERRNLWPNVFLSLSSGNMVKCNP